MKNMHSSIPDHDQCQNAGRSPGCEFLLTIEDREKRVTDVPGTFKGKVLVAHGVCKSSANAVSESEGNILIYGPWSPWSPV